MIRERYYFCLSLVQLQEESNTNILKELTQRDLCRYIRGSEHGSSELVRELCKSGGWKCWGLTFFLSSPSLGRRCLLVSAMKWCFPPRRFHSSEPSPGASPLAAEAELTPFLQHRLAGGSNSLYKSLSCGALMQDKENWVQCPLLPNESRPITCTKVPCPQIACSFLLLQCPAWCEKSFTALESRTVIFSLAIRYLHWSLEQWVWAWP